MRSVNEDLSWRDLKLILAATARKTEPDNPGWETGAQKYMSDSEDDVYEFNEEYGFGVVDASAAVGDGKETGRACRGCGRGAFIVTASTEI